MGQRRKGGIIPTVHCVLVVNEEHGLGASQWRFSNRKRFRSPIPILRNARKEDLKSDGNHFRI